MPPRNLALWCIDLGLLIYTSLPGFSPFLSVEQCPLPRWLLRRPLVEVLQPGFEHLDRLVVDEPCCPEGFFGDFFEGSCELVVQERNPLLLGISFTESSMF